MSGSVDSVCAGSLRCLVYFLTFLSSSIRVFSSATLRQRLGGQAGDLNTHKEGEISSVKVCQGDQRESGRQKGLNKIIKERERKRQGKKLRDGGEERGGRLGRVNWGKEGFGISVIVYCMFMT